MNPTRVWSRPRAAVLLMCFLSMEAVAAAPAQASATNPRAASTVAQSVPERPKLIARVSRFQGDPVKKIKGPKGFDLQFRLVGLRFDGTFGIEGLPQDVPEGEPFEAQVKLTNVGAKDIRVAGVTVTGDGLSLTTNLLVKKVGPKSSEMVATFKVPPQSTAGSRFLITISMANGDRHQASLFFARPSATPSGK